MKGPHGRGVEREGRRSIQFERLDFPVVGKADKRPGIYASQSGSLNKPPSCRSQLISPQVSTRQSLFPIEHAGGAQIACYDPIIQRDARARGAVDFGQTGLP
jgi:hypothetical protein